MTAGLNLQINVWRMTVDTDDSVGGAVATGTVTNYLLDAAITARRPSQGFLEQGLETDAIYDLTTRYQGLTLYERDEIEVMRPLDHPLYGLRFRVMGVQPSRRRPKHGHQHATLSRIRESRSQQ